MYNICSILWEVPFNVCAVMSNKALWMKSETDAHRKCTRAVHNLANPPDIAIAAEARCLYLTAVIWAFASFLFIFLRFLQSPRIKGITHIRQTGLSWVHRILHKRSTHQYILYNAMFILQYNWILILSLSCRV